jgi:hypothetical protein
MHNRVAQSLLRFLRLSARDGSQLRHQDPPVPGVSSPKAAGTALPQISAAACKGALTPKRKRSHRASTLRNLFRKLFVILGADDVAALDVTAIPRRCWTHPATNGLREPERAKRSQSLVLHQFVRVVARPFGGKAA